MSRYQKQLRATNQWRTQIYALLNQFDQVPTSLLEWRKAEAYKALIQQKSKPIRQRIQVQRTSLTWANSICRQFHYLKTGVSGYACPFAYRIMLDDAVAGIIIVGTPFARRLKNEYGYPNECSCWEVLQLYRFWIIPALQQQSVPDSTGKPHTLAIGSCAMGKLIKQVETDWLEHHPPQNSDQPYRIRKLITYSDSTLHSGTLYKSSGFRHDASQCGTSKNLDRWIYDLPETADPLKRQHRQISLLESETTGPKQRHDQKQIYQQRTNCLDTPEPVNQLNLL